MVGVEIVGRWVDGPVSYVTGITDSVIDVVAGQVRLYTASREGVLVWTESAGSWHAIDAEALLPAAGLGAPTGIEIMMVNGQAALIAHGPATGVATRYAIGTDGQLDAGQLMASTTEVLTDMATVETVQASFVYGSARGDAGVTCWQLDTTGQLAAEVGMTLPGGDSPVALAALSPGSTDLLLVLDAGSGGLVSLSVAADGTLSEVARAGAPEGLQIATPTALETVTLGSQTYALVGAAGTGSISVVAVAADGTLTVTDQVNDDLSTRFASLQALETVVIGERVFVLAAGGDDGLSLLELLPTGRLLHQATLADSADITLANVTSLTAVERGGVIEVFATSESEAGISLLRFDPGADGVSRAADTAGSLLTGTSGGDVLMSHAGGGALSGWGGDDVLIDGAGADDLWGGKGADVFVLMADGVDDHVMDFELGVDRLDLSGLGRAYSVSAFDLAATSDGLKITFGSEVLYLHTKDGTPLDPSLLTTQDLLDLWHVNPATAPDPPGDPVDPRLLADETVSGTSGADDLFGAPVDTAFDPYAAQVFRLYQATLGRAPDTGGLVHWAGELVGGLALEDVAMGFTRSAEFQGLYGATSDGEFVTLLYQNVLGRAPDATGFAGWTGHLAAGTLTREQVVVRFSESPEFVRMTEASSLSSSHDGLRASWSDEVFRLYQATLGRAPDAGGLVHWAGELAGGRALESVTAGFTRSAEFQARYGATSDGDFVTLLYQNVLGRAPDATGFAGWTGHLATGTLTREQVVVRFSESPEFVRGSTGDLITWMRGLGTDDRMIGGSGDDLLHGGFLSDTFVFSTLHPGHDTVVGLERWDHIELDGFGYADVADALTHFSQTEAGVHFQDQGVDVTFAGTELADITAEMIWLF